jgi:hypothetical protein
MHSLRGNFLLLSLHLSNLNRFFLREELKLWIYLGLMQLDFLSHNILNVRLSRLTIEDRSCHWLFVEKSMAECV